MAGVDDRDERGLGVAARDDGARLRLAVDVVEHRLVEVAELLAARDRLALVAQRNAEGQGVSPDAEYGVPYFLWAIVCVSQGAGV